MAAETDPLTETARLAELEALHLLDPETERTFDRIAGLARTLAQADTGCVTIVGADKLWQRGISGLVPEDISRDQAFTERAIEGDDVFWVSDAFEHPELRTHPYVVGEPHYRFYAGAPIRLLSGARIGAVCVLAKTPRPYDLDLAERLQDLAAIVADECERRRAQRDLERAEAEARAVSQLMSSFVRAAPVALAMTDRQMRMIHVSPRWRTDLRMEDAEVLGRSLYELFPGMPEPMRVIFERCLEGESVHSDKVRFPLPDAPDTWLRAEVTPWRDVRGEVGGLLIMTHNISDMVASLEAAESSERRLQLALGLADLHVYEINFAQKTLRKAGDERAFFDWSPTYEDQRRDIWCTTHPDDRAHAMAAWERHVFEGQPFRVEYRVKRNDNKDVWVFSTAELVPDLHGRPERLVGVLQNITKRKQAEFAAAEARAAAEAANRAKSEFLANMSHEIRTPLNGVLGVAGALACTDLAADQRGMVELIETSACTLESLLSDVLDLARIESGRLELKQEEFDLPDAIRVIGALFEPQARAKGLSLETRLNGAARARFSGDIVRLRQIVSNLLSNAVKFTQSGRVALVVDAEPAGELTRLMISVEDSGIGFTDEVKARLFQRFEQADGSITRRYGGTGLGLAISRSLAEAMLGTLEAVSEPGKGSKFTLTLDLPRVSSSREATASAPVRFEPSAHVLDRAPRVLLAEDHPTNRRVVELILGAAGVELTCVENGQQALDAFDTAPFDLILMDVQMPVMDGLTATAEIRRREQVRQCAPTPIYALTANAMPEHAEASRRAGADDHLTKPIAAQTLIDAVRRACEIQASAETEQACA